MDELTFLLILSGIGVVLLVAMFTYYRHHKNIHDEIQDFNHYVNDIDDVLLNDPNDTEPSFSDGHLTDEQLPGAFSATKHDSFDIDQVNLNNDSVVSGSNSNDRELVDGVYINTKRVISTSNTPRKPLSSFKVTTDTFHSYVNSNDADKKPVAHKEEESFAPEPELEQEPKNRARCYFTINT